MIHSCLVEDPSMHQSASKPSQSLIRFHICDGLVPGFPRNLLALTMSSLVDISLGLCPVMQGTIILQ